MPTLARCSDEWLVRMLARRGVLEPAAAEAVLRDAPPHAAPELLRRGAVTKGALAEALLTQYGIRFVEPRRDSLDKLALSLVPEKLCHEHSLVPVRLDGDDIEVLMANPLDAVALDAVAAASGRRAAAAFGLPDKIEELIAAGYGSDTAIFDLLKKMPEEAGVEVLAAEEPRAEGFELSGVSQPVTRLANLILAQAVRLQASDIHIEHDDKVTNIRYRIDGDLRSMMKLPKAIGEGPLVSRIKIMARLDVADRRRPQDGRAELMVGTEEIGLRVSTIPTSFGEKAVLRILDRRSAEVPLEALGMRPELLERLVALASSESGMLLVTGPTGSGKTTTLYSLLHRVKSDLLNVVTVEDPIEYRLAGINQVQVNDKAGMSFASVLRSVLRQDPDVVLVGEIRDRETADIAFQAALTGHLVLSSLHTNDSTSAVARLLDMGVERFKMGPALLGVAAQRLVRRVCPDCRAERAPEPALAERLRKAGLPVRAYKGRGCERCSFTGLRGRVALTELLDLRSPEARRAVDAAPAAAVLRAEAGAKGWLSTLSDDALWHIAHGDVTPDDGAFYLEPPLPAGVAAPQPPAAPARRRVLIVDDVRDNRLVMEAALSMDGYDLVQAAGGAEALAEISRTKPDFVLLDLMMPEIDGFAVLKTLRGEMGLGDLPVMIVTAMGENESHALALELGADDYMTKPFSPKVLRARVKARFRRGEYAA
ncbi:MAG: Flp pilus assembly complex ATPase component TadA [Elusimicrobiota bacterium]|nr:MAG: Flp pilus assembly complex ATPase component TadA [Elusimicrobiota bacterium]